MSYQNFKKALKLAKKCEDYDTGGGKSDSVILAASNLLNIAFSKQTQVYFSQLGHLTFSCFEVYGIIKDDFSGIPAFSCVESALADRRDYNLPKEWLPIFFFDDGYYGYLDYSQLDEHGEPPVIAAHYDGEKYVVDEKVADDFGDFLLQLVEETLSEQSILYAIWFSFCRFIRGSKK